VKALPLFVMEPPNRVSGRSAEAFGDGDTPMGGQWKRVFVLLAVVAVVAAAGLVGGVVALNRYLDPFDDQPFSPAAWSAADSHERGPMARSAIRHVPPGTPASQVRELLGEPQPADRDPRGPVDVFGNELAHPKTWAYYLGCWSGLGPYGFDSAFLYVHFGSDGRVVAAEITGG